MPIKKTWGLVASIVGVIAALAAPTGAFAATAPMPQWVDPLPPGACTTPDLQTPFSPIGDNNLYYLAPGGSSFSQSDGWILNAGASVTKTLQPDGSLGDVLDLPSKATATSPPMCITSAYPTARLNVRNIVGSEGVFFNVQYLVNGTWTKPKDTGQFHGGANRWSLSNPMNIQPLGVSGWQQVRFTFYAGGSKSRFQVDNFWVDPRASR